MSISVITLCSILFLLKQNQRKLPANATGYTPPLPYLHPEIPRLHLPRSASCDPRPKKSPPLVPSRRRPSPRRRPTLPRPAPSGDLAPSPSSPRRPPLPRGDPPPAGDLLLQQRPSAATVLQRLLSSSGDHLLQQRSPAAILLQPSLHPHLQADLPVSGTRSARQREVGGGGVENTAPAVVAMAGAAWPPSSIADLLPASLSLTLLLASLVVVLVLAVAAVFFEHIRKIGCMHSLERTAVSDAFFEDPSSLNKVPCPSIFDPAEKYISLIIPAYNEEYRLPEALTETLNYLKQRSAAEKSFSYEVLIVDDGSTDHTSKVAFDYVKRHKIDNVRVLLLGRNHGKGEAVRKGMLHSRGELLLMLDADGATKVTDLAKLEAQVRELAKKVEPSLSSSATSSQRLSDVEIAVFGSRAHLEKQAIATRKWYRNFLMKGFHLVVLLTAGPGIRDTQCGFKMFTRAAARKLFTNIRLKRWCFDVEIVYLCKHLRIPMAEVSVNWTEIPGSKVRMISILHMLFELLLIKVGYGLGIWKIYS